MKTSIDFEALEKIKSGFHERGETVKSWAIEKGFKINAVYRVLNGFDKCRWGEGHRVAKELGLKK
jgi:gp16 family phage-associated protein